jgi:NADPH:quinone reductase
VRCEVKRTFKLADAAAAHRALEQRETTGSSVLLP